MIKSAIALGMLLSSFQAQYVNVDSIEYYQKDSNSKEIIFDFNSDYLSSHTIDVTIDFYECDDTFSRHYSNQLSFIGHKKSIAKIDYTHLNYTYALINVIHNEKYVIKNARINFYIQENCYLDINNNTCDRIYKSVYKNGKTYDEKLIFIIDKNVFNMYLPLNRIDVEKINIHTNMNLEDTTMHLNIKEKIDGYDLLYTNEYSFLLDYDYKRNSFLLMDNFFYKIEEFKYSEKYFNDSIKTSYIYFPFSGDVNEYNLEMIIETFIDIRINFMVYTMGNLFGDCNSSKYCLIRER